MSVRCITLKHCYDIIYKPQTLRGRVSHVLSVLLVDWLVCPLVSCFLDTITPKRTQTNIYCLTVCLYCISISTCCTVHICAGVTCFIWSSRTWTVLKKFYMKTEEIFCDIWSISKKILTFLRDLCFIQTTKIHPVSGIHVFSSGKWLCSF